VSPRGEEHVAVSTRCVGCGEGKRVGAVAVGLAMAIGQLYVQAEEMQTYVNQLAEPSKYEFKRLD
jgi:hypothetical protein